jgi:xylulokinase
LLGGISAGVFTDAEEAVSRCVQVGGTVEPDSEWADRYDELYGRFRSLYPALRRVAQF